MLLEVKSADVNRGRLRILVNDSKLRRNLMFLAQDTVCNIYGLPDENAALWQSAFLKMLVSVWAYECL